MYMYMYIYIYISVFNHDLIARGHGLEQRPQSVHHL